MITDIPSDFNILQSLLLPHTCWQVLCRERDPTHPIRLWSLSSFNSNKFKVYQSNSCTPIKKSNISKRYIINNNSSLFHLLPMLKSHSKEVTTELFQLFLMVFAIIFQNNMLILQLWFVIFRYVYISSWKVKIQILYITYYIHTHTHFSPSSISLIRNFNTFLVTLVFSCLHCFDYINIVQCWGT